MKRLLLLLVLLVPILEIWGIALVGNWIGPFPTIALILASGFLGWHYARKEGLQTLRVIQLRLSNREIPGDELIDGLLILVGGIFLIVPGFLTDIVGLFLIIPYTRGMIRLLIQRTLMKSISKKATVWSMRRK